MNHTIVWLIVVVTALSLVDYKVCNGQQSSPPPPPLPSYTPPSIVQSTPTWSWLQPPPPPLNPYLSNPYNYNNYDGSSKSGTQFNQLVIVIVVVVVAILMLIVAVAFILKKFSSVSLHLERPYTVSMGK